MDAKMRSLIAKANKKTVPVLDTPQSTLDGMPVTGGAQKKKGTINKGGALPNAIKDIGQFEVVSKPAKSVVKIKGKQYKTYGA